MATRIITSLLLSSALAGAAEYFVATTGNDSTGTGSEAAPWRTIQHAANTASDGDAVRLVNGDYNEYVECNTGGIAFIATNRLAKTTGFIINADNISLENIAFVATAAIPALSGIIEGGSVGSGLTVRGCSFYSDISSRYHVSILRSVSNHLYESCYFGETVYQSLSLAGDVGFHVVTNCTFTSTNGGDAIRLLSSNTTLVNNLFTNWSNRTASDNHTDLIQGFSNNGHWATNNLIEGNLFVDCHKAQIGNLSDNRVDEECSRWVWRNNVWQGIEYVMGIYAPYMEFYNNTFYESGVNSTGPYYYGYSGEHYELTAAMVDLDNDTIDIPTEVMDPAYTGGWVRFFREPPAPLAIYTAYRVRVVTNNVCTIHATLEDSQSGANVINLTGAPGATARITHGNWRGNGHNGRAYNNIFVRCGSSGASAGAALAGVTNTVRGYYVLQTSTGGVDPLFVNVEARNFQLTAESPCIGVATNLNAFFTTDITGATRGDAWDIGAYEFTGEAEPGPTLGGGTVRAQRVRATVLRMK